MLHVLLLAGAATQPEELQFSVCWGQCPALDVSSIFPKERVIRQTPMRRQIAIYKEDVVYQRCGETHQSI